MHNLGAPNTFPQSLPVPYQYPLLGDAGVVGEFPNLLLHQGSPSLANPFCPPPLPPLHADHPPAAFQSAMLQLAATEIEKEAAAKEVEKQNYLAEHCPPLSLPGSMQELQVKTSLTLSLCWSRKDLAPSVSLVDLDCPSRLDRLLTNGCPGAGWMWNWLERQMGSLTQKKGVWLAGKLCF